jgi:carboxypeptidase Q
MGELSLDLTPKTLPPAASYNVIADWKGSDHPEQVVIVSGHLDSWDLGTGAVDDGAGVVTAMETIQLLHSLGIHPRRCELSFIKSDVRFGESKPDSICSRYAFSFLTSSICSGPEISRSIVIAPR